MDSTLVEELIAGAADVLLGPPPTRVPGKYERLCWERQERDLRTAYGDRWDDPTVYGDPALSQHPKGYWFDPPAGERPVQFIEHYCRHFEGDLTGQLIILEEWQRKLYRIVFAWKRPNGARRFRTAYIEIPRKNGKSVKGSGTGLYLTVADGEGGAQVYSAATKKDQAKIVHDGATKMVKMSPELRPFVRTFRNNISVMRTGSKFEPLGADSRTLDGLNTHGLIEDETHAHTDRHVHDVIVTSMGARSQPLSWIITTAGVYDPESIGWELHERATQVLDGVIEDDTFFAFIAAADEGDDFADPATWAKANPNLGISVKLEYMAEQCDRAKTTPSYLNTFLRYHLNIWTQQRERWIPIEKWNACTRVVDETALHGKLCCGGLDLSSKIDLTALTLAFPQDDGFIDFVFRVWCPEESIQRRSKEDRVPYDAWQRAGWLTATPGNVVDYDFIIAEIKSLAQRYEIHELAFDPWNATQTAIALGETGITCVEFRQGFGSMSEPSKEFEKLVVSQHVGHCTPRGIHPVVRWAVSNVAIRRDPADNIKPDKSRAIGRIDPVVSSIMALGRAIHRINLPVWEVIQ
jgi:phage terminase large subunit-like protein